MTRFDRRSALAQSAAVLLALGLLYWHGRCRTFGPGDSPAHVVSAITWGVSSPPGYPLYTMLGHLASRLPWGGPAGNVNGLSGLLHALTVALFFLTLRRLRLGALPALVASGLMGLSPLFWYYSEIAEARPLNDLLAVGAVWAAVRWQQERRPAALWALAAIVGLGLGHHPTFVLILPALLYWVWPRRAELPGPGRAAALSAVAAAGAILPYAVLGLRLRRTDPAFNLDDVRTWGDVAALALRSRLGGPLHAVGGGALGLAGFDFGRLAQHAWWMLCSSATELLPSGLALAGVGAWSLWRKDRRQLAFWGLWFAFGALGFLVLMSQQLTIADQDYARAVVMRFYILPFIALFALSGFGAQELLARVRPAFGRALAAAVVAIPLLLRPIDLSSHDPLMDYARGIVASCGESDIVVLAADNSFFALTYLDLVEGSTGRRVFLAPALFGYPPYWRRLSLRHPDLRLPPPGPWGLTEDWGAWMAANPGRKVYAEAVLSDSLRGSWPESVPSGMLVELRSAPARPADVATRARRFVATGALERVTRWNLYTFTPEVYLLRPYAALLSWYTRILGPGDPDVAARLSRQLTAL